MMALVEKLQELLDIKFQEEAFQHLFLIEIKQAPGDVIDIFIDSDTGVMFQHCVRVSRYLEEHIEENEWLGEKYTLNVSSAGIEAPLKLKRQYVKNIGREVSVDLKDDHKNLKGELTAVTEDNITVVYEEKVKIEGKKKKELITITKEVPFNNINKTTVKVSFK